MSNRQKRLTHDEAFVELENVELVYGRGDKRVQALTSTSLTIGRGDFVALVGPSGCGKSTILKLVTGLLKATKGYVYVSGREVGAEPMRVGMAFQNPTLLPWKTIRDNVMLPLKIVPPFRQEFRSKRKTEFRDRVDALLKQVGLAGFGDKYPWQLSGGMMQRAVAVAREQLRWMREAVACAGAAVHEQDRTLVRVAVLVVDHHRTTDRLGRQDRHRIRIASRTLTRQITVSSATYGEQQCQEHGRELRSATGYASAVWFRHGAPFALTVTEHAC